MNGIRYEEDTEGVLHRVGECEVCGCPLALDGVCENDDCGREDE